MSYAADFTLSGNAVFQNQVQMAMTKAAVSITSEARTVRNVVDQKRNALAVKILNNPVLMLQQFTFAAIESGLTGVPTDAQVDGAVSSVWNGIAGVTPQDLA
jgi:hypothetical protein